MCHQAHSGEGKKRTHTKADQESHGGVYKMDILRESYIFWEP